MTDKRFQQINLPSDIIDIKNGKIYHTLSGNDGYGLCNLLNELHEENEELESFKKLVYLVLKKEYDLRMNEMNILAKKEDWQGYMATKLERGTAQRIAKRLGVDLE